MGMDKKRILVVDDEPAFTRMVKLNLDTLERYEVHVEHDARQILATVHRFRPDLILLDVIMPHLDGGDVLRRLEADSLGKNVLVIFLTAVVKAEEVSQHEGVIGGHRYLSKPVRLRTLVQTIEKTLAVGAGNFPSAIAGADAAPPAL